MGDGRSRCGLLMIISHGMTDAYTKYRILNMLDPRTKVEKLELVSAQEEVFSHENENWAPVVKSLMEAKPCLPLFCGNLQVMLCPVGLGGRRKTKCGMMRISKNAILRKKASSREQSNNSDAGHPRVPYLTTNSILTSKFMSLHNDRDDFYSFTMPVNLRNRSPALSKLNRPASSVAGNQFCVVRYIADEDVSPVCVRDAVETPVGLWSSQTGAASTSAWHWPKGQNPGLV